MAKNTPIPDSDEERAMRTESGHFYADRARARGESALDLSVVGASPFRRLAKSIPSSAKEQSPLWPTSNPPVAKLDCACGQKLFLPWTVMHIGVNTLLNLRQDIL